MGHQQGTHEKPNIQKYMDNEETVSQSNTVYLLKLAEWKNAANSIAKKSKFT